MIATGLDLSLTGTGIATITTGSDNTTATTHTITSKPTPNATIHDTNQRIRKLRNTICHHTKHAHLIAIEGPAYNAGGSGAHNLAGLWWAIVAAIDHLQIPYVIIPPAKVKKFACGVGGGPKAGKAAVAAGITRMWGDLVTPTDDNQFDALGMATMCAIHATHRGQLPIRVLERHYEVVAGIDWPPTPVGPDGRAVTHLDDARGA